MEKTRRQVLGLSENSGQESGASEKPVTKNRSGISWSESLVESIWAVLWLSGISFVVTATYLLALMNLGALGLAINFFGAIALCTVLTRFNVRKYT